VDEIAEGSSHRICGPPDGDFLVLYGLEMKYKWHYFLAAVFFASYLLVSRGVPLLPVLAGCVMAAFVTWWRLARQNARGR
jgi:Flp pilus assembly protein TadB